MLRSAARPLLSARRAWSNNVGKSLGISISSSWSSHDVSYSTKRPMSTSDGGQGGSAGDGFPSESSFSIPGFGSSPITPESDAEVFATTTTTAADAEAASTAAKIAEQIAAFEPTWWPSDQALLILNWVNETAGMPCYAYAIGATTLAFRLALFPLFVKGQRNSSRMAHMQPELKAMKDRMEAMGSQISQQDQVKYMNNTRALFRKYDCNPLASLAAPLASMPIFMSMFFALRHAPEVFPDLLRTGGMLWFTDLTAPDPYCVMPCMSAAMFLGMTEVGKDQMMASDPVRGRTMVNFMRGVAIIMVPITMSFNSGVFVYWTVNNSFSFAQSILLKQDAVRRYFGIWEAPKPVPGQEAGSIFDEVKKLTQKKKREDPNAWAEDRVKAHNEIVEQQKLVKKRLMEKEGLAEKGGRQGK